MSDEAANPFEQLAEIVQAMALMATGTRAYYVALTGEGFTDEQALALTIAWQSSVIALNNP